MRRHGWIGGSQDLNWAPWCFSLSSWLCTPASPAPSHSLWEDGDFQFSPSSFCLHACLWGGPQWPHHLASSPKPLPNCTSPGLLHPGSFVLDDLRRYSVDLRYLVFQTVGSIPISTVIISEATGSRTILHAYRFVHLSALHPCALPAAAAVTNLQGQDPSSLRGLCAPAHPSHSMGHPGHLWTLICVSSSFPWLGKASWWLTSGGGAWMCLRCPGRAGGTPLAPAASSTSPMAPVPLCSTTRKAPPALPCHHPPISSLTHHWGLPSLPRLSGCCPPEIAPILNDF